MPLGRLVGAGVCDAEAAVHTDDLRNGRGLFEYLKRSVRLKEDGARCFFQQLARHRSHPRNCPRSATIEGEQRHVHIRAGPRVAGLLMRRYALLIAGLTCWTYRSCVAALNGNGNA